MSAVEQFTCGANWTVTNVFSGKLSKSKPFTVHTNGQAATFTLSAGFMPVEYFKCMQMWHCLPDGYQFETMFTDKQVAIYVRSSSDTELVPKLALKANDGSWYSLPINWLGSDGTTSDKRFFGSVKFMANVKIRNQYMANDKLKVKFTMARIGPMVLSADSELNFALGQMFEDGLHVDMLLVTEGKEIKVSKNILAARSSVFAAMFEHKLDETKSGRVNITDVEYEPLRALVKYLYTDSIEISDVLFALKVFVAADKYDVPSLKKLVEDYISTILTSLT